MNELEKKLLQEAAGDAVPSLCIRTGTRVDAGKWFRKVPLWLCIVEGRLVLLAVARRMYLEAIPLTECVGSEYFHANGELVLKPVEGVEFDRIAMTPAEALKVLEEIKNGVRGGRERVAFDAAMQ